MAPSNLDRSHESATIDTQTEKNEINLKNGANSGDDADDAEDDRGQKNELKPDE